MMLEAPLNQNQITYILYHLNLYIDITSIINDKIVFVNDVNEISRYKNKIIFPLSSRPYLTEDVLWSKDIPFLFPLSEKSSGYTILDNSILFNHDFLKSAFLLLSGYQEQNYSEKDELDRFSYESSIQYKLNMVHKPVVNYYFEILIEGIQKYCDINNINCTSRSLFNNFGFMLSHDVDRIDMYDIHRIKLELKKYFKVYNSHLKQKDNTSLRILSSAIFQYLNIFNRKNPYWDFDFLRKIEHEHKLKSVFFLLNKHQLHVDSYYSFSDKRINKLIKFLESEGCEIGLHGVVESSKNESLLKTHYDLLNALTRHPLAGIRQHRLSYVLPDTAKIHENIGLRYDATLGFAAHTGFRNSFSFPFKLYNFPDQEMIDVWQFPLNTMDATLFDYMQLSIEDAFNDTQEIINEIRKFNGLYSLLWHNGYFNEAENPGITNLYKKLISHISSINPETFTGSDLVDRLDSFTIAQSELKNQIKIY